ncbi:MAG: NAD-dependent epimerase/dehydratase family protein, partial [Mycobacteriales bacterium]
PRSHAVRPAYLDPRVELIVADLRDVDAVQRALDGVDAVSHQAAMVGLGVDFGDVADYVSSNDGGTAALLLAAHRAGWAGRLVLASSMVVYGEGRYSCAEHGPVAPGPRRVADLDAGRYEPPCPICSRPLSPAAVTEDAPVDPRNVYAATKVMQEHLGAAWSRSTGAPVTALRYHNVYGPRMPRDTPYAGVAAIFRSALESGGVPTVLEDGGQLRDFVHVDDVARANVLALTAPAEIVGAFNVCSGQPHTVGEMAVELSAAYGGRPPVIAGGYRLGDVRHVFASAERAATTLGFRAAVGFAEGVREFAHAPLR